MKKILYLTSMVTLLATAGCVHKTVVNPAPSPTIVEPAPAPGPTVVVPR